MRLLMLCLAVLQLIILDIQAVEDLATSRLKLTIWGAANDDVIRPMLEAFTQTHQNVYIEYREFSTVELYQTIQANPSGAPDVVLSPAMDLQFKLVNDGYAQAYSSPATDALPDWAKWRDEIFAFAFEPIVMVVNKDLLGKEDIPRSREQLLSLIRTKSPLLQGKVGLSDIETVGLGYLTWFHDSQQSRTYGRLLESFGSHHAKLYPNTNSMLNALRKGDIFIAYNLVGSYAFEWAKRYPWIEPIMPTDYTSAVMRTAFIPKAAQAPNVAKQFMDFLLTDAQYFMAQHPGLIPIDDTLEGPNSQMQLQRQSHGIFRPIPLGLPLLVQTDNAKKELILEEWRQAMHPPAMP